MQSHTKNCPAHNGRLHPDFYHADHYRVTSRSFVPKNYRRSLCIVTAQHKDQSWLHGKWKDWSLERWAMSFLASAILLTNPMPSLAVIEQEKSLDPDVPVVGIFLSYSNCSAQRMRLVMSTWTCFYWKEWRSKVNWVITPAFDNIFN